MTYVSYVTATYIDALIFTAACACVNEIMSDLTKKHFISYHAFERFNSYDLLNLYIYPKYVSLFIVNIVFIISTVGN
jgi:hypothetical protein